MKEKDFENNEQWFYNHIIIICNCKYIGEDTCFAINITTGRIDHSFPLDQYTRKQQQELIKNSICIYNDSVETYMYLLSNWNNWAACLTRRISEYDLAKTQDTKYDDQYIQCVYRYRYSQKVGYFIIDSNNDVIDFGLTVSYLLPKFAPIPLDSDRSLTLNSIEDYAQLLEELANTTNPAACSNGITNAKKIIADAQQAMNERIQEERKTTERITEIREQNRHRIEKNRLLRQKQQEEEQERQQEIQVRKERLARLTALHRISPCNPPRGCEGFVTESWEQNILDAYNDGVLKDADYLYSISECYRLDSIFDD